MRNRGRPTTGTNADRGVSELLGYVLLVGMVMTAAVMLVLVGVPSIEEMRGQQSDESTELLMEELDSRLSSMSTTSGVESMDVPLSGDGAEQIEGEPKLVTDQGYVNVTVNRNGTCSVNVSLDSIRVNNDRGEVFIYEGGGLWRQSSQGGVTSFASPDILISDGNIHITLQNMTGSLAGESNLANLNVSSSRNDSRAAGTTLFQGNCKRPDNITLTVKSDLYQGWGDHFQSETGYRISASPPGTGDSYLTVDDGSETTTVYLNQSALPARTDDERNSVVDVTNKSSYMRNVTISKDGISIDKGNKSYNVYAEPVAEQVDISTFQRESGVDNVTRRPLDVAFVVDESGSMLTKINGTEKRESVKNAIRNFTTKLSSDIDRVGLVGFQQYHSNRGKFYRTNDKLLTDEFSTFNSSTLSKLEADGGTYTAAGMKKATSLLSLQSNETRDRVIVFLSDGRNDHGDYDYTHGGWYSFDYNDPNSDDGWLSESNEWWVNGTIFDYTTVYNYNGTIYDATDSFSYCGNSLCTYQYEAYYNVEEATNAATIEAAKLGNESGITTYTVGFGDATSIPDYFLTDVAEAGGGWYNYTANQDELEEAFELIANRVSSNKLVTRTPFSTNLTANGTLQPPQVVGDTDNIANVTAGGETYLNVNDPTAPSTFSHAFSISDGEMVNFSSTVYGCDQWVGTSESESINGSEYTITRCSEINESAPTTVNASGVYTNVNSSDFTDMLNNSTSASWQTNLTDAVVNRSLYNESTQQLTLESNQALVLYDFPDGPDLNTDNRMLMLYEVGISSEAARASGVIDIQIDNIELQR